MIESGVFAYSPLNQTDYSTDNPNPGLDFEATYRGGTIAVDADGSIYQGSIRVTVDLGPWLK